MSLEIFPVLLFCEFMSYRRKNNFHTDDKTILGVLLYVRHWTLSVLDTFILFKKKNSIATLWCGES